MDDHDGHDPLTTREEELAELRQDQRDEQRYAEREAYLTDHPEDTVADDPCFSEMIDGVWTDCGCRDCMTRIAQEADDERMAGYGW